MNRPAPRTLDSFLFRRTRFGASSKLPNIVATSVVAATMWSVASPVTAFQYPKFLQFSQSVQAPVAAKNLCRTYSWACAVSAEDRKTNRSENAAILEVNASVNRRVREIADDAQFQQNDVWRLPTHRGGDCEDFALLKKQELIQRGLPAQSLLIATVLDRDRQGHAVLIVRTAGGDLVLDNLTNQIRYWSQTGYTFLRMQDPKAPNRWVSLAMAN